ncbi:MAG: DUF4249 family protein [Bacteroidota bacterium]
MIRRYLIAVFLPVALVAVSGCGTVEPEADEEIVIEAFVSAGDDLPVVTVRTTAPLRSGGPSQGPADDAHVSVSVGEAEIPYLLDEDGDGRYIAARSHTVSAGDLVRVQAERGGRRAWAHSTIPQSITVDSVAWYLPAAPVKAALVDSVGLTPAARLTGFLYLIDVDIYWHGGSPADETYVRAQVRPHPGFSSLVLDLFLRSDQVFLESSAPRLSDGRRVWRGVYAVQVDSEEAPLPEHRLRISLLRSGRDYAQFALSRNAADRREPLGNVEGGLGIVAGVAVDSVSVHISADGGPGGNISMGQDL